MNTYLLVGVGEAGHALPMLSIAQALAMRGHRVLAYFDLKFQDGVAAAGAEFVAPSRYQNPFDQLKKLRSGKRRGVLARLRGILKASQWLVRECVPGLVYDLKEVIQGEGVDCVVACFTAVGARYAAELTGCHFVSVTPNPLLIMGQNQRLVSWRSPASTRRMPVWMMRSLINMLLPLRSCRTALGLPPVPGGPPELFRAIISDTLHMVTVPISFLPVQARLRDRQLCVGPVSFNLPAPGSEPFPLNTLRSGTVLVSTSTIPVDPGLFRRTLEALAPLDIPILATAASATDLPQDLGPNIRIESFVPHAEVLPHVAALVTHGGWGIVGRALRLGVPMLITSLMGDQPTIGARLAEMGLAYHLPHKMATQEAIREQVSALLKDQALLERVQAYALELQTIDSQDLVADTLEALLKSHSYEKDKLCTTHPNPTVPRVKSDSALNFGENLVTLFQDEPQ